MLINDGRGGKSILKIFDMDRHLAVGDLLMDIIFDAVTKVMCFFDSHFRRKVQVKINVSFVPGEAGAEFVKTYIPGAVAGDDQPDLHQFIFGKSDVQQGTIGSAEEVE